MQFLRSLGKKVKRVVSRDPRTINAYRILRINALVTDDMLDDHYRKLKKDQMDSHWLREVDIAYKILIDPELREIHDDALRNKFGLEDLFFVETKQMGLNLFGLKPTDVKPCTDKPIIRTDSYVESGVLFTPETEQEFHEQCANRLLNNLRVSLIPSYADGLFAVINYDFSFVPNASYDQKFRDLTLVMACSCNIFVYVPKPIQFSLNRVGK
tara:strand:+ start:711 stop:1346 length:636 start_codon:yes stop_codon:yes gene_type:complete